MLFFFFSLLFLFITALQQDPHPIRHEQNCEVDWESYKDSGCFCLSLTQCSCKLNQVKFKSHFSGTCHAQDYSFAARPCTETS